MTLWPPNKKQPARIVAVNMMRHSYRHHQPSLSSWLTLYGHIKTAEQWTTKNNTVKGTMDGDRLAVTFGTASKGMGGLQLNILMWHYNCLSTLKG